MNEIHEARFYCNPYSLLIINRSGKLRRVFCPFKAKALEETPLIKKGKVAYVTLVKMRGIYGLVFVIEGKEYESALFSIIL